MLHSVLSPAATPQMERSSCLEGVRMFEQREGRGQTSSALHKDYKINSSGQLQGEETAALMRKREGAKVGAGKDRRLKRAARSWKKSSSPSASSATGKSSSSGNCGRQIIHFGHFSFFGVEKIGFKHWYKYYFSCFTTATFNSKFFNVLFVVSVMSTSCLRHNS